MSDQSQDTGLFTSFAVPSVEEMNASMGDGFEVESILGKGGMAVVYKAIDKSENDMPVAIKILPREIAARDTPDTDFDYISRFEYEAQAMARLSHMNIVRVYKMGKTEDGLHFFSMEFVDGNSLYEITQQSRYTQEHVFSWLIQICDALEYAHKEGFVHRDIKPGNILIDHGGLVKIADFGLVKVDGHKSLQAMDTMIAMGTPDFSAPEIIDYREKGDHRSDIYSVGIMAYMLFTGKLPKGLWETPSQLVPELDRRVDRIIDSALHSNQEKRYQSIGEMCEDFKKVAPDSVTGVTSISIPTVALSSDHLHQQFFSELSSRDFEQLYQISVCHHLSKDEVLMEKDHRNHHLSFLAQGKLHVVGDDHEKIAELTTGHFVGEMSYLTGNRPSATVVAAEDGCYLAWEFTQLRELCEKNLELRAYMDAKISSDLVEKLTT
ncbi:MAG: serine/threonine-protein kinase [Verrucomicrobiota bacterium]